MPDRDAGAKETLAIPASVRAAVDERDHLTCRVCGKWLGDRRALHHIVYGGDDRGIGGRRVHDVEEIITVCWMFAGNCHDLVHRDKRTWQPILLALTQRPGMTGFQLKRWIERHALATDRKKEQ